MSRSYLTVEGAGEYTLEIRRSVFITTLSHIESAEEAEGVVRAVRKKYSDATHNCYAYIADESGLEARFSDDGEPGGTAGQPMLEVLKKQGLRKVVAVVTRYFGGIKLGAGGLVRAYSGCVAENLDAAEKLNFLPCEEYRYTVGYESADICSRFFEKNDCELKNTEYSAEVSFTVAVKKQLAEQFNAAITDRLNGRIRAEKLREFVSGFKM